MGGVELKEGVESVTDYDQYYVTISTQSEYPYTYNRNIKNKKKV